jgi:hypothetical protein
MGFQLFERALRYAQELDERTAVLSAMPSAMFAAIDTAARRIWLVIP